MNYQVKPLSSVLGVQITGIDLRMPLSETERQRMLDLFHDYQVIVFRNQELTPEQQIKACGQFGEIELHPLEEVPWKHRELTYVANIYPGKDGVLEHCGPPFELWHSDTCYLPQPAKMSLLYAEQVPAEAGETLFADMYKAYEDLSNEIKLKINGKTAVFGSGSKLMERCKKRGYDLHIREADSHPNVSHPVIRTHPVTKRSSIFVNWAHTDYIEDMSAEESDELLDYIYEHCRKAEYVYTHEYRPGDLIVWDNACTLHSNTAKKLSDIRIMRRVMIKGSKPYYGYDNE
jgi:taurine dioxygenase